MTVHTHTPSPTPQHEDDIRIMPTSDDLNRPHSEKQLIDDALAELQRPDNLIASSRQQLPQIRVNGVLIDRQAIAQETQYHPADSIDDALFLSAQALVMRELLKQAVCEHPDLGQHAWGQDEEQAISSLITKQVRAKQPDLATCQQYFNANAKQFVTPTRLNVRHILLASPPDAGDERITLKQQAHQLIEQLQASPRRDADFIEMCRQHSACPSSSQGGELGWLQQGQTVPEFEQALKSLPVGISVNPIASRYGIHVVEVLAKEAGTALSFEQAQPMIANQLSQQSFHHALCDYLYQLSKEADIEGIELSMNEDNTYRG